MPVYLRTYRATNRPGRDDNTGRIQPVSDRPKGRPRNMQTKFCKGCRQDLPVKDFYRQKYSGNLQTVCKECKKARQREIRAEQRAAGIPPTPRQYAKTPKICECGQTAQRKGLCYDCFAEQNTWVPTLEQIEADKLLIRRENGHDPKQPRLFQAARH